VIFVSTKLQVYETFIWFDRMIIHVPVSLEKDGLGNWNYLLKIIVFPHDVSLLQGIKYAF
jgi:hypothetical protein